MAIPVPADGCPRFFFIDSMLTRKVRGSRIVEDNGKGENLGWGKRLRKIRVGKGGGKSKRQR